MLGVKDVDLATLLFSFAVAATCGLGDGVESSHGAVDEGKVDIDTSFDELGRNQSDWEIFFKALADDGEHFETVLRAHEGGEVIVFF